MTASGEVRVLFLIPPKKKSDPIRLSSTAKRIVVGSGPECGLTLEDPLISAAHLSLECAGTAFFVADEGSATGTYLNGFPVTERTQLSKDDVLVLGCSRIKITALDEGGAPQLKLGLEERRFQFIEKAKSGEIADLYQLARAEVGFGRSPSLALANVLGGLLALGLVGLLFLAGPRELLAEPGALHVTHARLFDDPETWRAVFPDAVAVAEAQGCAACHEPFGNTPLERCASCHGDLLRDQHPFSAEPLAQKAGFEQGWTELACVDCHVDHPGAETWGLVPPVAETPQSCDLCHESRSEAPAGLSVVPVPRTREVAVAYDAFSHADHLAPGLSIACTDCHTPAQRTADAPRSRSDHDFDTVLFETCEGCHSTDATRLDPARVAFQGEGEGKATPFRVDWHGADDDGGAQCQMCHAKTYEKELGRERLDMPQGRVSFELARFFDHGSFFEGHPEYTPDSDLESCATCHFDDDTIRAEAQVLPFWHGLHLATLYPQSDAEMGALSSDLERGCQSCHTGISSSGALAADPWRDTGEASCAVCHEPDALLPAAFETRSVERARFPHDVHVAAFGRAQSLAQGCFACHAFDSNGESDLYAFPSTDATIIESCGECHDGHAEVGGGACQMCHAADDSVWSGSLLMRDNWPELNTFDHQSAGHVNEDCSVCHMDTEGATRVRAVPIPSEDQDACRKCHLGQQKRFHWR